MFRGQRIDRSSSGTSKAAKRSSCSRATRTASSPSTSHGQETSWPLDPATATRASGAMALRRGRGLPNPNPNPEIQVSKFVNGIPPCRIEKNRGGDGSGSGTGFQFPAQKILQLLWSSISPCCLTACPAPPTVDNVSKTYNVYCSGPDRRIGMQWYLRRGPRLCGRVGRTEARRTGGSIPSRSEQQDQDVRAQTHAQASEVRDDEQRGVVIDISGGGSTQC